MFLTLAGDVMTAGMRRAALSIYQLIPSTDGDPAGPESPENIRLAAIALIHETSGNVRGAMAAYLQLALRQPAPADRPEHLYQLVRTASVVGDAGTARQYARVLSRDFPTSPHLAELREAGMDLQDGETAAAEAGPPAAVAVTPPVGIPGFPEFTAALDLYQGRRYQEAKAAFLKIEMRDSSASTPGERIFPGFYQLECMRKLGDLEGLATALRGFVKNPYLGASRLRQLEIDGLWDAVRTREWERLDRLAADFRATCLPGDQRAQVAFCHGLALENLSRRDEALLAYNIAMTADAGASEEIARQAACGVMRMHRADPEVRAAMAGPKPPAGPGFFRLQEAAAVAALYELSLGAGMPLPADFKEFLKYKSGT